MLQWFKLIFEGGKIVQAYFEIEGYISELADVANSKLPKHEWRNAVSAKLDLLEGHPVPPEHVETIQRFMHLLVDNS